MAAWDGGQGSWCCLYVSALYVSLCYLCGWLCVCMYMYTFDILVCVVNMHVLSGNTFLAMLLCKSRGTEQQGHFSSLSGLIWYFSLTRVFIKYSKNKSWQVLSQKFNERKSEEVFQEVCTLKKKESITHFYHCVLLQKVF